MSKNKLCCRIFPVILIFISFLINLGIWYFDNGIHSFSFLTNKLEIFNFAGTLLFIAIIPIGLFYWLNDKEKYQARARGISLLGFLPAFILLIYIIL